MATNPQREILERLWKAALGRLETEVVKGRLDHTGPNSGAEFRGLIPGYNRNPARGFVESWLAERQRRARRIDWAIRIGSFVVAVLGVAVAL